MSTILDALKKSEQERKANHVPTLSDMPVPQEKSRWPFYLIAVLVILLALAAGLLLGPWFASSKSKNYSLSSEPVLPLSVPSSPSDTASVNEQNKSATKLATVDDVVINVISYSDSPAQRFVMLNGKMYRENDFVKTGLKVEAIKPSAVVLNLRGELVTRSP